MSLPTHISASPGNLLTLEQAAKRSGFSEEKLKILIEENLLPAVRVDESLKVEQRDLETLSQLDQIGR